MIEPRELRIGNIASHPKWGQITVREIFNRPTDLQQIYYINSSEVKCDMIEPIPLTEEWLLKFGKGETFTKPLGLVFKVGKLVFGTMNNYESIDLVFDGGTVNLISIKHVHQLQNLYHSLAGEELKINQ